MNTWFSEQAREWFEHTSDGLFLLDPNWRIVAMNPKGEVLSGRQREEVEGRRVCTEVFICHDFQGQELCDLNCPKTRLLERKQGGEALQVRLQRSEGGTMLFPGVGLYFPATREEETPLVGILIRDERAQRQLEEILLERERRDPLTGLFHRQYFEELLGIEVKRVLRHGGTVCLLMLDVVGLEGINRQYGDAAGDAILQHLGQRIRNSIREVDLAARFSGDEFVILLYGADTQRAQSFLRRFRNALRDLHQAAGLPEPVRLRVAVEISEADPEGVLDRVRQQIEEKAGEIL